MIDHHPRKLYMDMALRLAQESKDPKMKVGALIVTPHGVLYPGYNGDYRGGSNKRKSMEQGQSGFIHAEENALLKFDPSISQGSVIYVSHSPCEMCASKIINAISINAVYFHQVYKDDMSGVDLLKSVGIHCEKI